MPTMEKSFLLNDVNYLPGADSDVNRTISESFFFIIIIIGQQTRPVHRPRMRTKGGDEMPHLFFKGSIFFYFLTRRSRLDQTRTCLLPRLRKIQYNLIGKSSTDPIEKCQITRSFDFLSKYSFFVFQIKLRNLL